MCVLVGGGVKQTYFVFVIVFVFMLVLVFVLVFVLVLVFVFSLLCLLCFDLNRFLDY